MKTYWKFAVLVVVIVGSLVWLAAGGIKDTKEYYKTVAELNQMGDKAQGVRLRVAGDVEAGSIVRKGREVAFVLTQDKLRLKVVYNGSDPLPDTFRDGAQALAFGRMGSSDTFQATQIQAKCASKYQSAPNQKVSAPLNKAGM